MDKMIVMTESAGPVDGAAHADLTAALTKRIRQSLGLSVDIQIGAPGSVPRSQGKALRVVDNRPKE